MLAQKLQACAMESIITLPFIYIVRPPRVLLVGRSVIELSTFLRAP